MFRFITTDPDARAAHDGFAHRVRDLAHAFGDAGVVHSVSAQAEDAIIAYRRALATGSQEDARMWWERFYLDVAGMLERIGAAFERGVIPRDPAALDVAADLLRLIADDFGEELLGQRSIDQFRRRLTLPRAG